MGQLPPAALGKAGNFCSRDGRVGGAVFTAAWPSLPHLSQRGPSSWTAVAPSLSRRSAPLCHTQLGRPESFSPNPSFSFYCLKFSGRISVSVSPKIFINCSMWLLLSYRVCRELQLANPWPENPAGFQQGLISVLPAGQLSSPQISPNLSASLAQLLPPDCSFSQLT